VQFEFAEGLRIRGGELNGFAIRAADGQWVWAKGEIQGQENPALERSNTRAVGGPLCMGL